MRNKILLILGVLLMGLCEVSRVHGQEVGLQLYSLRNEFKTDVEGTLALIQKWGITKVEGGDTYGMSLDTFRVLLKKYNLEVVSLLLPFETFRDAPEEAIALARAYGARYVGCAWIPHTENEFSIKETGEALTVFNRAGKLISEAGLKLFYHPHGYELKRYNSGTLLDYMIAGATHFDFQMDVYWIRHGGQDPMELLQKYPDRFILMHMKDMAEGVKGDFSGHSDVRSNVVLGEGQLDISGLILKAWELGMPYVFIEDESPSSVAQIPLSLNYLRSIE